jgi:hypothetical protein
MCLLNWFLMTRFRWQAWDSLGWGTWVYLYGVVREGIVIVVVTCSLIGWEVTNEGVLISSACVWFVIIISLIWIVMIVYLVVIVWEEECWLTYEYSYWVRWLKWERLIRHVVTWWLLIDCFVIRLLREMICFLLLGFGSECSCSGGLLGYGLFGRLLVVQFILLGGLRVGGCYCLGCVCKGWILFGDWIERLLDGCCLVGR